MVVFTFSLWHLSQLHLSSHLVNNFLSAFYMNKRTRISPSCFPFYSSNNQHGTWQTDNTYGYYYRVFQTLKWQRKSAWKKSTLWLTAAKPLPSRQWKEFESFCETFPSPPKSENWYNVYVPVYIRAARPALSYSCSAWDVSKRYSLCLCTFARRLPFLQNHSLEKEWESTFSLNVGTNIFV